jgi:type VI secretion system secreted protein Hcp
MALGDMFLKLDSQRAGLVKGESEDPSHPGEIQIDDWSWGMSGTPGLGAGSAGLKTALDELHIHKRMDSASTALMSVMRNNDLVKKAVLSVRKSGGVPIDYLVITLEKARITRYEVRTAQGDGPRVMEHLALTFEKIDVAYYEQDEKGQRKGATSFSAEVRTV